MIIYIITYILILLIPLLLKNNKKKSCITIFLLLFTIILCKSPELGNSDTVSLYIPNYYRIQNLDLSQIKIIYAYTDFSFYILTKIIQNFTSSLNIYFALCALPILLSVSKFIYKYSNNISLSYIIFFTFFYPWCFIIIRHSVAWGFLLYALIAFLNNKKLKTIILILIASLFHKTAILFLLIFLSKKKYNIIFQVITILVLFILCTALKSSVQTLIYSIISSGHYALYADRISHFSLFRYLVFIFIFLFIILFRNKISIGLKNYKIFHNILWIGCLILNFAFVTWDFFRIGMYFTIIIVLLLPIIIESLTNINNKKIIYFLSYLLLFIYGINTFSSLNLFPFYFNFM